MTETVSDLDLAAKLREKIRKHKPCKGYGHVMRDGKMQKCECRADAEYAYRLHLSGIPPKYRKLGFKDFVYKDGQAYAKVKEYLGAAEQNRQDGIGLYLYGPSCTGKTLLACSLLSELMKAGWECKYLSFDGLLDAKDDAVKMDVERQWDFLVLDKVGDVLNRISNFRQSVFGDQTHGAVDYLTSLLSKRLNSGRPMILTGMASLAQINAMFPSLANALIGSCVLVECEDKGFRQKSMELMMDPERK